MAEQQETFISHLVELRDRLLRCIVAILVVFLVLWFWPGLSAVYDLLAKPMIDTLPEGTYRQLTGELQLLAQPTQGRLILQTSLQ